MPGINDAYSQFQQNDEVTDDITIGGGSGDWGDGIGADVGNLLYNWFGNYTNPSSASSQYLNQIPGKLSQYYSPYISGGQFGLNTMQNQVAPAYQNLMQNPTAVMNQIGSTYKASPGYQYNVNQATNAANQAAAAGGFVGSPAEQQSLASNISGMASQDYQNYMNQGLGMYSQGLQGLSNTGQFMGQLGYGASNQMAQGLMSSLMSQAQNAYAGANTENQQSGGMWNSIADLLLG